VSRRGITWRIAVDLILLLGLLVPAAYVLGAEGLPRGLATVLALAWLFPVSQLAYAEFTAISFEQFARERLRNGSRADEALYTAELIDASSARFAKRVLGVFRVPREGRSDDLLVGASALNQFPLRVGEWAGQPQTFPPLTRRIGTAETPFLSPLSYIHLFALEFHRRLHPTLDRLTLSGERLPPLIEEDTGACPAPGDRPELHELDAGLRRVGEWFRNRLDDDPDTARDDVHARSLFYFAHQAERLRHLLGRGRRGEPPSAADQSRFWALMRRVGVRHATPDDGQPGGPGVGDAGPDDEAFYTARVNDFARRFHITAVHPIWIDLASFAPRLILVGLLVAFLHGGEALSPADLLLAHLQGSGVVAGAGLGLLAVGLVAAAWSYRAYSTEWVLRPMPWALRRIRSGRGWVAVVAALVVGLTGCAALTPGLSRGEHDLAGIALPALVGGLLAMEAIAVSSSRVSFLAAMRHYHYRPAVSVGGPRLVLFHFLHYLLFLGLGAWIGETVAPFLEGHLVTSLDWRPLKRPLQSLAVAMIWPPAMALAVALALAALRRQRGWPEAKAVRPPEVVAVLLVAAALVLHRSIGGLVVGGAAVITALYLAHHSIFILTVGLTALVKAIGSPMRLAALAVPGLALGLASGEVQRLLGLETSAIPEIFGGEPLRPVWGVLSWLLFVAVVLGMGDPAFAVPTGLAALGGGLGGPWWGAIPCQTAFWLLAAAALVTRAARWGLADRRGRAAGSNGSSNSAADSNGAVTSPSPCPDRLAVLVTATNPVASLALLMVSPEEATKRLLRVWDEVIAPSAFPSAGELLDEDGSRLTRDRVAAAVRQTFLREWERRCSLFGPEAIVVVARRTPMQAALEAEGRPFHLICPVENDAEAATLRLGLRLIRYLTTRAPCSVGRRSDHLGWPASQRDTAAFLVQLALAIKEAGLHERVTIYLQANKWVNRRRDPEGDTNLADPGAHCLFDTGSGRAVEYEERLALGAYLRIVSGVACEVTYTHSFDACKAAAQNGQSGSLDAARWAYVLDRNSQCFSLRELIEDIRRIVSSSDMAAVLPVRSTPNLAFPVGSQADLAENGFSVFAEALVNDLGGDRGEMIGTGWGNLVALPHGEVARAFADPKLPYRFDPRQRGPARWFGAIYGMTNSPHLSEDYVQVIGATEQLKSLGRLPRLGVGHSLHYKLREHTSFLEFRDSRPRWAGGGDAGQKGQDPFLQRLRELGTDSIFMREMQKNRGRYYLLTPLAMLNVLVASTLVLTGYAPFTGISVLFWIGLACNQALTLNGLASYVRRAGPWGGAATWLSQRFRDVLLLPPLAFIEMSGVLAALMKGNRLGFVFRTSGRSDVGDDTSISESVAADTATYGLVACMVVTGLLGTVVNLFAISQLDLANVIMLYPSLMFIEGLVLGGFVYWGQRGPGRSLLGVARWAPKVLGCILGLLAVVCFALGVGVAREVEWRDLLGDGAVSRWLTPVPLHVAILSLTAALVFWMLPARSALVRTDGGQSGASARPHDQGVQDLHRWHNLGVVTVWALAVVLAAGLGLMSDGLNRDGLSAAVLFSAVGLVKLSALLMSLRVSPHIRRARGYFRETLRRSAIVSVGATIWFVLVPVPAQFSFQFLDYSLTFTVTQLGQALAITVQVIGVVLVAGVVANAANWQSLRAYHGQLHRDYHSRLLEAEPSEAIAAVVEAALEGYRVARDTYAPATAAWMLRTADRALDSWATPHTFFDPDRPAPRRPVAARLRRLRLLCSS